MQTSKATYGEVEGLSYKKTSVKSYGYKRLDTKSKHLRLIAFKPYRHHYAGANTPPGMNLVDGNHWALPFLVDIDWRKPISIQKTEVHANHAVTQRCDELNLKSPSLLS